MGAKSWIVTLTPLAIAIGQTVKSILTNTPLTDQEIEIIGSFVVPEFGTIAVLILAIAIISIIAVSSKTKLSILPKY